MNQHYICFRNHSKQLKITFEKLDKITLQASLLFSLHIKAALGHFAQMVASV